MSKIRFSSKTSVNGFAIGFVINRQLPSCSESCMMSRTTESSQIYDISAVCGGLCNVFRCTQLRTSAEDTWREKLSSYDVRNSCHGVMG